MVMIPWSSRSSWENEGSKPSAGSWLARRVASTGAPGISPWSIFSQGSTGPQWLAPTPTQNCGKFSRKKLVKCSLEQITTASAPCSLTRRAASSTPPSSARGTRRRFLRAAPSRPRLHLRLQVAEHAGVVGSLVAHGAGEGVDQHRVDAELVQAPHVRAAGGRALILGQVVARRVGHGAVPGRPRLHAGGRPDPPVEEVVQELLELVLAHRPLLPHSSGSLTTKQHND